MRAYNTRSKEFGPVSFIAPTATATEAGSVMVAGGPFTTRRPICYGGEFDGDVVRATRASLRGAAQEWLRQRREARRMARKAQMRQQAEAQH